MWPYCYKLIDLAAELVALVLQSVVVMQTMVRCLYRDTNLRAGEIFATEIRNAGGLAKTYAIDLADPKAIKSFVAF